MGFILEEDTSNVQEFHTVPNGSEIQLRIAAMELKKSKKGDPMIEVRLGIPEDLLTKDVFHYIMLPTGADDEKRKAEHLAGPKPVIARFKTLDAEEKPSHSQYNGCD